MASGARSRRESANILPETLNTETSGPNGNVSEAPLKERQCSRSAPAFTTFYAWVAASVRVLVLPPGARLVGGSLGRPVEQEAVIRGDERVGRHHRVGVVAGAVLARERDPARALAQAVSQLRPDLARPLLEAVGRVADHLLHLGDLLRLL